MRKTYLTWVALATALVVSAGCEDDDVSVLGRIRGGTAPSNRAPTVTISNTAASLTGELSGGTLTVALNGSATDDGTVATLKWSSDPAADVSFAPDNAAVTTATFSAGGEYTVTLSATDDAGVTASTTVTVQVGTEGPPTVTITGVDITGGSSENAIFALQTGASTGLSLVPAGTAGTSFTVQSARQNTAVAEQQQGTVEATEATAPQGKTSRTVTVDYK